MADIEITLKVGADIRKYKIGLSVKDDGVPQIAVHPTVSEGPAADGDPVSYVGSFMVHDYLTRELTKNPALAKVLAQLPEG